MTSKNHSTAKVELSAVENLGGKTSPLAKLQEAADLIQPFVGQGNKAIDNYFNFLKSSYKSIVSTADCSIGSVWEKAEKHVHILLTTGKNVHVCTYNNDKSTGKIV